MKKNAIKLIILLSFTFVISGGDINLNVEKSQPVITPLDLPDQH